MPVTALVTPGPEVTRHTPTPSRRARIGVGRMDGGLLVPDQDVFELLVGVERVVDVEDGAAGIAEDVLDAFFFETADDDLRAGDFH